MDAAADLTIIESEIRRLHERMCMLGATHTYALAVTPGGLRWADVDGRRDYPRLVERYGHCIVGYYNARVDRMHMLMDALHEARKIGLI